MPVNLVSGVMIKFRKIGDVIVGRLRKRMVGFEAGQKMSKHPHLKRCSGKTFLSRIGKLSDFSKVSYKSGWTLQHRCKNIAVENTSFKTYKSAGAQNSRGQEKKG